VRSRTSASGTKFPTARKGIYQGRFSAAFFFARKEIEMPSMVLKVQGTAIRISTSTVAVLTGSPTFASLDCISRDINYQSGSSTEIDVTSICSTSREFRLGLPDAGTLSISGYWKQGTAGHTEFREAYNDKNTRLFEIEFEDGSTFRALGFVQQRSFTAAVDGVVNASYTVRLTGDTNENDPSTA
jgi:hypothetical protein